MTARIIELVVLQGDRVVFIDPDDDALGLIADLIIVEQLLQPIETAAIVEIEDFGIEHQMIVIVDPAAAEIADDIVPNIGDAAPVDHRYVGEDETIGTAAAAENVVAAVTLNDVVAARTNNVLYIADLRHRCAIGGRALRPQE